MKEFIKRFAGLAEGTLCGFDRIVFKGLVLPLMSSNEMMSFRSLRLSADPEISSIKTIKMDAGANSQTNREY